MNLNLLLHTESLDLEHINIDKSECLDNIQEILGKIQEENYNGYKPLSFDDLEFSWGEIYELFDTDMLTLLNADWFIPYAYGTFSQLYALPLSPQSADNLVDLRAEFPKDCNAWLGCDNGDKAIVYDLVTLKSVIDDCETSNIPKKPSASQINQLINTQYKHFFERLDTPTVTSEGNLHGEQIQIHLNDGKKKNIGALNIDGTWKHKPAKTTYKIPSDAKNLLLEWGFKLPKE